MDVLPAHSEPLTKQTVVALISTHCMLAAATAKDCCAVTRQHHDWLASPLPVVTPIVTATTLISKHCLKQQYVVGLLLCP